jgi:gliding motility-associated-like protein
MNKFIFTILLFLTSFVLVAQTSEPTVSTVDGRQRVCINQALFTLEVVIRVPAGYPKVIDRFELTWSSTIGGAQQTRTIPGTNNPAHQFLQFNLSNFFNTCIASQEGIVRLDTYNQGEAIPLNNAFFPTFLNPPKADFIISDNTICKGSQVTFRDNSCPTGTILTNNWDLGGGITATGTTVTQTYNTAGTFTIKETVTNECGSATAMKQLTVIDPPVSVPKVDSGAVTPLTDPIKVCLGSGGLVKLNGIPSLNENSYEWDVISGSSSGYNWLPIPNHDTARIPYIRFILAGNYTIQLTVRNDCPIPDTTTLRFEVIDAVQLTLNPQPDVCNSFSYTPSPYIPGAIYKVDNVIVNSFPIILNVGAHTTSVTLTNACGTQTLNDAFNVTAPQNVQILSPADNQTVCQNSPYVYLKPNIGGGSFSGGTIVVRNDSSFFNPVNTGNFTVTYNYGTGNCQRSASITITVIADQLALTAQPDVCLSINYTPSPFNPNASYKVDNTAVSSFPVVLNSGNHIVSVSLTNACGTKVLIDTFDVTVPQNVQILSPPDNEVLCKNTAPVFLKTNFNGGTFTGSNIITRSDSTFFDPVNDGNYQIVYAYGIANCERIDTVNISVVSANLSLIPQPDACISVSYKPDPYFNSATYLIDNIATSIFPVNLGGGQHIVKANLVNACGNFNFADTFTVFLPVNVSIVSPLNNYTVCKGSTKIALIPSLAGGTFVGNNLSIENNVTYFDPINAGPEDIIYKYGFDQCERFDTVRINVNGVSSVVQNISACSNDNFTILNGSPSGGTWSSTDCPTCVVGNNFFISPLNGASSAAVTYIVTDTIGCKGQSDGIVSIVTPKADFNISSTPCGSALDFNSANSVGDSYIWKIDGVIVSPPPYSGLTEGIHIFELRSYIGNCYDTVIKTVNVKVPPPPANFNISPVKGCSPLVIQFSATDPVNPNNNYSWTITKSPANDTIINQYAFSGPFTITNGTDSTIHATLRFNINNECGQTYKDTIITVYPFPTAIMGLDSIKTGCSPYQLILTNRSTGEVDSCFWNLGDGIFKTDCERYFNHTYYADGSDTLYYITLNVKNQCGVSTTSDSIKVKDPRINAFYNLSKYIVCPFDTIRFQDASTPIPSTWIWKFGDGSYSNEQNPIHVFNSSNDTFNVTLSVSNGCGYDTINHTLVTLKAPIVDFELPPYACQGQRIENIKNLSPTNYYKYIWNFNNQFYDSTHYNPTPTFSIGNTDIQIGLKVVDFPSFCSNTVTKNLYIRNKPVPNFKIDSITCYGKEFEIPNLTTDANNYVWYYDNKLIYTNFTPTILFDTTGEHIIKLIADYNNTCIDSLQKIFRVMQCDVYIPNVFTPNNDGKNDYFTLYGGVNVKKVLNLKIFDRWGEMVFDKDNFPPNLEMEGWDGSIKNKDNSVPYNTAVFVYSAEVEFINGDKQMFKGDVTLIK